MKVWILNLECPDQHQSIDVRQLSFDRSNNKFSMPCIMGGDDFFQSISHTQEPPPEFVLNSDDKTVILLSDIQTSDKLLKWFEYANAEVEYGFRTMKG